MKRHIDLVVQILATIEKQEERIVELTPVIKALVADWPSPTLVSGHLGLMEDAGLIERGQDNGTELLFITWAGHDFLDERRPK